ncbi:uncharacterized protein LOC125717029 isoform X1 [Brienomyrus brachyistius]|uniref:uncharacterized protein LOC125717029 isoform X1 n=2 Tax=Brienomyrus brachyistius TaxID=42636 RepID=UPI0020B25610|nr:uncharacterized protein LOC125717029 isoform X1 [Brienomyrus brachyistius]
MAKSRLTVITGVLLATSLLPETLWAGPVGKHLRDGDAGDAASEAQASRTAVSGNPLRSRRSANSPDFWTWYKFFMDTGNQQGVQDFDRLYQLYLQNQHRLDGGHSFGHYLQHLRAIYRACSESDDPDCIREQTSKPTAQMVMPWVAPLAACNPYLDPYCMFGGSAPKAANPELAGGAKSALPLYMPAFPLSAKAPAGYYSSPVLHPYLTAQQQEELLRICNPSDVECLHYHLRAAYGYTPVASPFLSYTQSPSGLYHMYPTCDPDRDPFCFPPPSQPARNPGDGGPASSMACDPQYDPYCLLTAPSALGWMGQLQQPWNRLGIRGKTKEGYDCYLLYDKECYPLGAEPGCHPYDPNCRKPPQPASLFAGARSAGDVIEPHPDCDPEYDYNCRLRRYQPRSDSKAMQKDEPDHGEGKQEAQNDDPFQGGHGEPYSEQHLAQSFKGFLKENAHQ